MAKAIKNETVFSKRLKQARLRAGFTQMQLGVLAGLDEFSASARVNQYERAVHVPDYGTASRFALVLDIPVSYLFESDDTLANIILAIGQLDSKSRDKLLLTVRTFSS
jgi:transcriptional regulator with XRE-family HTH domain